MVIKESQFNLKYLSLRNFQRQLIQRVPNASFDRINKDYYL